MVDTERWLESEGHAEVDEGKGGGATGAASERRIIGGVKKRNTVQ